MSETADNARERGPAEERPPEAAATPEASETDAPEQVEERADDAAPKADEATEPPSGETAAPETTEVTAVPEAAEVEELEEVTETAGGDHAEPAATPEAEASAGDDPSSDVGAEEGSDSDRETVPESASATESESESESESGSSPAEPETMEEAVAALAAGAVEEPVDGKDLPEQVQPFAEAMEAGTVLEGRVIGWNKGGYHVVIDGVSAFCPRSQIELGKPKRPQSYVDRALRFRVKEIRDGGKRIVVSRKDPQREERKEALERLEALRKSGEPISGRVTSYTDFGLFVDVGGGLEGLVHASQISHERVEHPREAIPAGGEVQARVLRIEKGGDRISLSMKSLEPSPWDEVDERFSVGEPFEGKIVRKTDFGLFVDVGGGIEGLVHVSTLPIGKGLDAAEYAEGSTVEGWIKEVDPGRRRLSLSLREVAASDPWKDLHERYEEGQKVEGQVEQSARFGVFIQLEPGLTGLLPASAINLPDFGRQRAYQPGQKVEVVIDSIDKKKRRLSLAPLGAQLEGTRADLQDYKKKQRDESSGLNAMAAAFAKLRSDS